jgi:mRNA-degrading endonuclease RelE of RelBE toxin-antitoxin system
MRFNPFAGDVRPLRKQPTAFRRRVGGWRILFDASPERRLIEVADVARRSSTTYRKR